MTSERSLYDRLSVSGAAATGHVRWASIDVVRALAALMVLAAHGYHLGGRGIPSVDSTSRRVFETLAGGVWLFFAVSGFLIAGPFLVSLLRGRPLPPLRRYAVRRAARILPAYWLAFATFLVLVGATVIHWWQIPVHGLLLHALVPNESQRLYFVAWTLGYEAIFYALVPLAALLAWRLLGRGQAIKLDRLAAIVVGLWVLSVAWGIALALRHPFDGAPLPSVYSLLYIGVGLGNFCPGLLVFLAETPEAKARGGWWARYRSVASRPLPALLVAGLLWASTAALQARTSALAFVAFHPMLGLASGLVLAAVLHGVWVRPFARVLAPIGLISYGIYLWHWIVVQFMQHHAIYPVSSFSPAATLLHVLVLAALTIPFALASWLALERPLLRRTAQWDRPRPEISQAAGPVAPGPAQA